MTLGLTESRNRQRRRRQVMWSLLRWLVVVAVAIGVGIYAYDHGTKLARQDVRAIEQELAQASKEITQLRTDITGLETALREERRLVAEWQERYSADVPSDEDAALLQVIRERLAAGISRRRLADVVAMASDDISCKPLPETRRFVVQNPVYAGANDSVSFADNTITVTALGEPSINDEGKPEAWFDPAKPVTVFFTRPGGQSSRASGVLPLHHAVAAGDREYRFSIVAGSRSFAEVTGQACTYP